MSVREQPTKVKMAIGIDNFREMREKQNYYVDKTRLITEKVSEDGICTLRVPNREVMRAFRELTALYIGAAEGIWKPLPENINASCGRCRRIMI